MWPALVLIVAAVLVPTVCVLWFMNKAMSNERIAVRQRLTAIYERELARATRHVDAWVADKLKSLATPGADAEPSATFAQLVRSGQFDSAVVLDDNGAAVYPCSAEPTPTEGDETPEWNTAQTLEFQRKDWTLALQAYQQLETESTDSHVQARALLAQARCLHRLDRTD